MSCHNGLACIAVCHFNAVWNEGSSRCLHCRSHVPLQDAMIRRKGLKVGGLAAELQCCYVPLEEILLMNIDKKQGVQHFYV